MRFSKTEVMRWSLATIAAWLVLAGAAVPARAGLAGLIDTDTLEDPFVQLNDVATENRDTFTIRGRVEVALGQSPVADGVANGVTVTVLESATPAPPVAVGAARGRVGLDDRAAAASAAQHLLALGHRRIGILVDRLAPDGRSGVARPSRISQASDRVARARVQGYLQQLEASGIARSSVPVIEAGGFQPEDYAKATGQLLDDYDVTAILVASDVMALEAMSVATQRGLSVPAELSVVGFDDAPGAAEAGLTTVSQPMVEKGRIAAQLLLKAIATGELGSVLLPTEFIVRSSTARPQKRRPGSR